jgi:hypothetical protein
MEASPRRLNFLMASPTYTLGQTSHAKGYSRFQWKNGLGKIRHASYGERYSVVPVVGYQDPAYGLPLKRTGDYIQRCHRG